MVRNESLWFLNQCLALLAASVRGRFQFRLQEPPPPAPTNGSWRNTSSVFSSSPQLPVATKSWANVVKEQGLPSAQPPGVAFGCSTLRILESVLSLPQVVSWGFRPTRGKPRGPQTVTLSFYCALCSWRGSATPRELSIVPHSCLRPWLRDLPKERHRP